MRDRVLVFDLPPLLRAEVVETPAIGQARELEDPLNSRVARGAIVAPGRDVRAGWRNLVLGKGELKSQIIEEIRGLRPRVTDHDSTARDSLIVAAVRRVVAAAREACPLLVLLCISREKRLSGR